MGSIRVTPGSRVKIKSLGTLGTVRELNAVKNSSGRGRPTTFATVDLDEEYENTGWIGVHIGDLKLV